MNSQLAAAIFDRWNNGLPVSEHNLYKAAEFVGEDPQLALLEARYYTVLDNYLMRGGEMSPLEKNAFALFTGRSFGDFEKIASSCNITEDELIFRSLLSTEFIPYLYKAAESQPGPQDGGVVQQNPDARQQAIENPQSIQQATGNPAAMTTPDWQGNPMYKPTPTAPGQVPPGKDGNMGQLMSNEANKGQIEAQKQQQMMSQLAQQTQQNPQAGSKEQVQMLYNQMTPQQKVQHAAPQVSPEDVDRHAQEVSKIEAQTGLKIKDPAQIKKIIGGIEKQDKQVIDQAIQQQFNQSQEMYGPLPGTPDGSTPGNAAAPTQPGGMPPMGQMKMAMENLIRRGQFTKIAFKPGMIEALKINTLMNKKKVSNDGKPERSPAEPDYSTGQQLDKVAKRR